MADIKKRLPKNIAGEFFVDFTCIDCDTCRQLAPATFMESGDYSVVYAQPQSEEERRRAIRALLACPTGSIGMADRQAARAVMADFPLLIEDDVYYCGFNSPKSYGGNSYFLTHPAGNWLIDSPKYLPHLVRRFEALGGVRYIFLTHRDDVAEAERYAGHFKSQRIIHRDDHSAQPDAEILIDGVQPVAMGPDFLIIPTPGHTRGHCVLLYRSHFLFSGDHVWWSRTGQRLSASQSVCWYSWDEQTRSMDRLRDYSFEWILPGHGQPVKLTAAAMREALDALVARMQPSHRLALE